MGDGGRRSVSAWPGGRAVVWFCVGEACLVCFFWSGEKVLKIVLEQRIDVSRRSEVLTLESGRS